MCTWATINRRSSCKIDPIRALVLFYWLLGIYHAIQLGMYSNYQFTVNPMTRLDKILLNIILAGHSIVSFYVILLQWYLSISKISCHDKHVGRICTMCHDFTCETSTDQQESRGWCQMTRDRRGTYAEHVVSLSVHHTLCSTSTVKWPSILRYKTQHSINSGHPSSGDIIGRSKVAIAIVMVLRLLCLNQFD